MQCLEDGCIAACSTTEAGYQLELVLIRGTNISVKTAP